MIGIPIPTHGLPSASSINSSIQSMQKFSTLVPRNTPFPSLSDTYWLSAPSERTPIEEHSLFEKQSIVNQKQPPKKSDPVIDFDVLFDSLQNLDSPTDTNEDGDVDPLELGESFPGFSL